MQLLWTKLRRTISHASCGALCHTQAAEHYVTQELRRTISHARRVRCASRGCELELDLRDASELDVGRRCCRKRTVARARWIEKRERESESAWKALTSLMGKVVWLLLLQERAETLRKWSARAGARCASVTCALCDSCCCGVLATDASANVREFASTMFLQARLAVWTI